MNQRKTSMMLLAQNRTRWSQFDRFVKKLEKYLLAIIIVFFFFVFPVVLIHISLSAYFEGREENLRQNTVEFLDKELEKINKYSNNRIYCHELLSKIANFAQLSESPEQYLQANFSNLKNNYPGEFSFIVWDQKGKIISSLTDWPGYLHYQEKLFLILKEITQLYNSNQELIIEELDIVKENIKILSSIFGNTFLPKNLRCPLVCGSDAGPFAVDFSAAMSFAWYSIGEKISFVCFISKSFLDDKSGLIKIVENINATTKKCVTGFFETSNFDEPKTNFPKERIGSLKLSLAMFENFGDNNFENDYVLVRFSIPSPSVRTFACYFKSEGFWKKDKNILLWTIACSGAFFLILIACIYYFGIKKQFLSLKWKIVTLVVFVNVIPAVVISSIVYEFLQNKKSDLRNELCKNITSELRSFDSKCNDCIINFENDIKNKFRNFKENLSQTGLKEEKLDDFIKNISETDKAHVIAIASDARIVSSYGYDKEFNKFTIKVLCHNLLDFSNNLECSDRGFLGNVFDPEHCDLVANVNANQCRLIPLKFDIFAFPGMCYFDFIKDKSGKNNDYCIFLLWNAYDFHKTILSKHYKNLRSDTALERFCITYNLYDYRFGDMDICNDITKQNISDNKNTSDWIEQIGNNSYLFVKYKSFYLPNWYLIGACSEENINKENRNYILIISILIILSFIFCVGIAYLISINFLYPISNLNTALHALKDGSFDYRIKNIEEDEFGSLERSLNRIIEHFGELNIAKNFQLALTPKNANNMEWLNIFGKTQIMTTMCGDYFDYFSINDEYCGMLIGDVAGHGVASGLIMAIAKAGVLTSDEKTKLNPALMLKRLNEIIVSVNTRFAKRMMTMQYLVINKDGIVTYANAGHCFPLIFDSSSQNVSEKQNIGLPLGIKKKLSFENFKFKLNTNETLILYTDGCFEFTEKNNEKFKFEKLKKIISSSSDADLEIFYKNLNDHITESRIGGLEDDITIVMVSRRGK